MSEPELASDFWLASPKGSQEFHPASSSPHQATVSLTAFPASQLTVEGTSSLPGSPMGQVVPAESLDEAALENFADAAEATSTIRYLIERVRNLERALDQMLISYDELRQQLKDRTVLEQQLAATEEYSQLQQHEIELLRGQVLQQKPQQVSELEDKLREAWDRIAGLEVQLDEARQQIARLCENLTDRQATLARSEAQLEQMQQTRHRDDPVTPKPPQSPVGSSTIASLLQELLKAQARIKTIESQLTDQTQHQELIQQAYQELESDHLTIRHSLMEHNPNRTQDLETRVSDMQEQILMQQQHLEEYETAMQHWQDRCTTSQTQAFQLKEALLKHLPEVPEDLAALLDTVQGVDSQGLDSPPINHALAKRKPKVELPAFLTQPHSRSRPKP